MHSDLGGELTGLIIGAAIDVHRAFGPGLAEPIYEQALCAQLRAQGISHSYQYPLPLIYKGIKLDCGYRMDVVIDRRLIIEIKSVEIILPVHEAQLLTYLRLAKIELGILLNFDVELLKDGIRRRALRAGWEVPTSAARLLENTSFDPLSHVIVQSGLEVHRNLGPGLLRSAYEEALCYELSKRRVSFERKKKLAIDFRELRFEAAVEIDLLVNGEVPVTCLSLHAISSVDRARMLSRLRQGDWRVGLILNFNVAMFRDGIQRVVN